MPQLKPIGATGDKTADFFIGAVRDLAGREPAGARVLDFGCGAGGLVKELRRAGVRAEGCDIGRFWTDAALDPPLRVVDVRAYRLPYGDATFDAVVSNQVFEHVHNKRECFAEIRRVLKPGGIAVHVFPPKWYLPSEPHTYVPLANWFWPRQSKAWLALWAMLGVRNEYQQGLAWRDVVAKNAPYLRDGVNYAPTSAYVRLSREVFGNVEFPTICFLRSFNGRYWRLVRGLPFQGFWAGAFRELRGTVLLQRRVD